MGDMRLALLYVGGWLAAVVVATAVGFAAISLVGDDVGAPGNAVALISTPKATDEPTSEATGNGGTVNRPGTTDGQGSTSVTTAARTEVTDGGTVTGRCKNGSPRLVSWAPKNEWSVAEVDTTGSRRAVTFSDGTTYVTVALRCGSGQPAFTVEQTSASPSPEPTPTETSTPTPTVSVPGDGS